MAADIGLSRTKNEANAWMAVDLGPQWRLVADHYALRNEGWGGITSTTVALRNWELQVAIPMEGPWVTLRRHGDDESLAVRPYAEAAWSIESGIHRAFRCFRIGQHRSNTTDSCRTCNLADTLACGGIELYGEMV